MSDAANEITAISDAVKQSSKTAEAAINAGAVFGKFCNNIFGYTVESGVGIVSDQLKYFRYNQLVSINQKFVKKCADKGL